MRRLHALTLSLLVVVGTIGATAAPSQADPSSTSFSWRFGNSGPTCTLSGSVSTAPVTRSGKQYIRVRGVFEGCGTSRPITTHLGIHANKAGKKTNYGGVTGVCGNAGCTANAYIPYTGAGTYIGVVYVYDDAYLGKHGTDPSLQMAAAVK